MSRFFPHMLNKQVTVFKAVVLSSFLIFFGLSLSGTKVGGEEHTEIKTDVEFSEPKPLCKSTPKPKNVSNRLISRRNVPYPLPLMPCSLITNGDFESGSFPSGSPAFPSAGGMAVAYNDATLSSCNTTNNSYDLNVVVTYADAPSGTIEIATSTGGSINVAQTTSPQTITLAGLLSNGVQNVDVRTFFTNDTACADTTLSAYNEPAFCSVCLPNTILPSDVLQPGFAVYACQAYNGSEPTLAVRDMRQMSQRYADPVNLACSYVDNSPFAPRTRTWSKNDFNGETIMGIAFDPRTGEIYAATSYLYNNSCTGCNPLPFTLTLDPKVYRISRDGNTIDLFATLPGNKGTGWLDLDTLHNQLYVSNLDDGQIYSISMGGGTNQTGPFSTFGFVTADALNEATTPVRPDWNMAPLGERVIGVGYNPVESRLYYSVWGMDLWNDVGPHPGVPNTIRSVAIDASGDFLPATDVLEFTLPYLDNTTGPDNLPFSMPVTDIVFSENGGRMIVAEQGFNSYEGWGGEAHNSRVLEYTGGTSGTWTAEPLAKFTVGIHLWGYHGRGGASFVPGGVTSDGYTLGTEDFLLATADAVADYTAPSNSGSNGASSYVDGAAFMPSSGSYSRCNIAGLDLDGLRLDPGKSAFGDIDVRLCKGVQAPYDLALTKKINATTYPGPYVMGDTVVFSLKIYNQGNQSVTNIQIEDTYPSGLSLIDTAWSSATAGTATLNTPIAALASGQNKTIDIAFEITAASGKLTNYAEISSFQNLWNTTVSDSDSAPLLGAFNDSNEVDNEIYGTASGEDHDDLDFATVALGTVGIGNLVFFDTDGNNIFTTGEGIDSVWVELRRPGYGPDGIGGNDDDYVILDSIKTVGGGTYAFTGLRSGAYIVTIPPTMFDTSGILFGYKSISGNGADNQVDDDVDENGQDSDNAQILSAKRIGVNSSLIYLEAGTEPTNETGFDGSGDVPDDAIDFTVDFGFSTTVGVGNLVWLDINGNGVFDVGEGAGGAQLDLYRPGFGPDGIAGNSDDADIVATTNSDFADGSYSFLDLTPGSYYINMPAYQFNTFGIGVMYKAQNFIGDGADNGVDDDTDENGLDATDPFVDGVRSVLFTLTPGTEPTSSETGFNGSGDSPDGNIDFTIDFGFKPLVGIGNQVWIDSNMNGFYTTGEGVDGVNLELYYPGFGPDRIAGNADDNDVIQTTTTVDDGLYFFADYPGTYVVKIPASQFQLGSPLYRFQSLAGNGADNGVDDNADDNGIDGTFLKADGISSVPITLQAGTEPANEPGRYYDVFIFDPGIDFTIDFGFMPCVQPYIGADQAICSGDTVTFIAYPSQANQTDSIRGNWTISPQSPSTTNIASVANDSLIKVVFYATGLGPFVDTVYFESTAGCMDTALIVVNTRPAFTARDTTVCVGNTVNLTTLVTNYTAILSPVWHIGSASGSIENTPTAVAPTSPTDYFLIGNNVHGCKDTAQVSVLHFTPPPIVMANDSICSGVMGTLDAGMFASYLWSSSETTQIITKNSGTYTVTVTDGNSCTASATAMVVARSAPVLTYLQITDNSGFVDDSIVCHGENLTFGTNVTFGTGTSPYTLAWTANPSENAAFIGATDQNFAGANFTNTTTSPVSVDIRLNVSDAHGCKDSLSVPIIVRPMFVIDTINRFDMSGTAFDGGICFGDSVLFDVMITPASAYAYAWSTGTITDSIWVKPPYTGVNTEYYVTITDSKGCTAQDFTSAKGIPAMNATTTFVPGCAPSDPDTLQFTSTGGIPAPAGYLYTVSTLALPEYHNADWFLPIITTASGSMVTVNVKDEKGCPVDTVLTLPAEMGLASLVDSTTCTNNGTPSIASDDYFTAHIRVTNAAGGSSGKYVLKYGGIVLNSGGTTYGTSTTIGLGKEFSADGNSSFTITAQDFDAEALGFGCSETLMLGPISGCSNCPAPVCIPVIILKD